MNTAPPLEYVTSFAEASQTMMQRLTTALITYGESDADFSRFAEVASYNRIIFHKWVDCGWKR